MDLIDDAGGGDVEDSGGAIDSSDDGVVIEEIDLEETKTGVCPL